MDGSAVTANAGFFDSVQVSMYVDVIMVVLPAT